MEKNWRISEWMRKKTFGWSVTRAADWHFKAFLRFLTLIICWSWIFFSRNNSKLNKYNVCCLPKTSQFLSRKKPQNFVAFIEELVLSVYQMNEETGRSRKKQIVKLQIFFSNCSAHCETLRFWLIVVMNTSLILMISSNKSNCDFI